MDQTPKAPAPCRCEQSTREGDDFCPVHDRDGRQSPPETDLDRKIAAALAEADRRTGPGPLAGGGELIRELATCLRMVVQELQESEDAWAAERTAREQAERDRDAAIARTKAARAVIVAAPHDPDVCSLGEAPHRCDCWKADALRALDGPAAQKGEP